MNRFITITIPLLLLTITNCPKLATCRNDEYSQVVIISTSTPRVYDSIFIKNENPYYNVYWKHNSDKIKIIGLTSMLGYEYVTTCPPIETVRLEVNKVQTDDESIRISIRNTDLQPDHHFIDIRFDKEWILESFGEISSQDSVYIKKRKIESPLRYYVNKEKNLSLMELEIYLRRYD